MKSQGIVVLGMHRSGTSMLAGLLHLAGAYLGETIEARADNPKGFWEHKALCLVDMNILHHLGCPWDAPLPLPQGWQEQLEHFEEPKQSIVAELCAQPLWAIKEPRLCHLFPWWREAFLKAGARLVVLLAVRNPFAVAASLNTRSPMPQERAMLSWCQHLLAAEAASRGLPRMLVDYEALLQDPLFFLQGMRETLRIPLQNPQPEALGAFVDQNLQNHKDASLVPATALQAVSLEMYKKCAALSGQRSRASEAALVSVCQAGRDFLANNPVEFV